MTNQPIFASEFPEEILPTQLRDRLEGAAPTLVDRLFEDLRAIESMALGSADGDTFAETIERTSVISLLPPAYRAWYSPLFVRALIVCAVRIVQALGDGSGAEPRCTAEELVWYLLLQEAIAADESQPQRSEDSDVAADVEEFEDFIYQDSDWKLLYHRSEAEREELSSMSPALQDIVQPVESWFEPFRGPVALQLNPYCRDLIPHAVDLTTGDPL